MAWTSKLCFVPFSIVQTGDQVMTEKGNKTLSFLDGKEDYSTLTASFGNIYSEVKSMIAETKITGSNNIIVITTKKYGFKDILILIDLN